MSRRCELTEKGVQSGNRVSHSKRHTRHRFLPNLQTKRLWSVEQGRYFTMKICTDALRTIDKVGLDAFAKKAGIKLGRKKKGAKDGKR